MERDDQEHLQIYVELQDVAGVECVHCIPVAVIYTRDKWHLRVQNLHSKLNIPLQSILRMSGPTGQFEFNRETHRDETGSSDNFVQIFGRGRRMTPCEIDDIVRHIIERMIEVIRTLPRQTDHAELRANSGYLAGMAEALRIVKGLE